MGFGHVTMKQIREFFIGVDRRRRQAEIAFRVREWMSRFGTIVGPYVKKALPNFRVAHFAYIMTMVFLGSVLVFPCHNLKYVDALFFTAGASTQAGLNTVDGNLLYLYQGIVIYIITTLTTPIFIHGSVLFVRLYWFERHFDNIKEQSKLDYKMRRSLTMSGSRTMTLEVTQRNTVNNQGLGMDMPNSDQAHSTTTSSATFEKEEEPALAENADNTENNAQAEVAEKPHSDGIKFGSLPQPPTRNRKEIDPSDMYRSIAMMQNKKKNDSINNEDDVLVIKPPTEIEEDSNHAIFIRKTEPENDHLAQFPQQLKFKDPLKKWKKKKKKKRLHKKWPGKLKRTFSHGESARHMDEGLENEDASIDSENEQEHRNRDLDSFMHDDENDEEDGDDEDDDDDGDDEGDNEDYDDDNDIAIVTDDEDVVLSDAQLPTDLQPNITRNRKFSGKSRKPSFLHSPTMQRVVEQKRKMSSRLRRNSSMMFGENRSERNSDDRDDDEEDDDSSITSMDGLSRTMTSNYLSYVPKVGRNSQFVYLTDEQKKELGGVEYRATKLLSKIVVFYYVGFHLIAMFMFLGYINMHSNYAERVRVQGVSPNWWACFTAQSSFNDLGLTVTYDSMNIFSRSTFILVTGSFFIVIGNTGFPVFLRFIIWILFKFARPFSQFKESLGFLLDHPRRCFTMLFPSGPTWWLFFFLVLLNGVDLLLFVVLDLNNLYLKEIPVGYRVLDGLFQAFSTRTAGFSVLSISELHPSVQLAYVIMMYISVLPIAISIRRTNVYEEQSLGIYLKDESIEPDLEKTPRSYIGTHVRNQLSFDLWYIFLGIFIICIAEGGKITAQDNTMTIFSVMFEVVSAYGTVGLSLGYPGINASLSGAFTTLSKLVIIAMMIRGRHRGLPYTVDRAIMLPNQNMKRHDRLQESHAIRRHQTLERANTTTSNHLEAGETDNLLTRVLTLDDNLFRRRRSTAGHLAHSMSRPTHLRKPSSVSLLNQA